MHVYSHAYQLTFESIFRVCHITMHVKIQTKFGCKHECINKIDNMHTHIFVKPNIQEKYVALIKHNKTCSGIEHLH